MWQMSDVESLWDAHFYIEQMDEVPLRIVDPIDLDAIPEVLLIDSDDGAPIEEIVTQVEPIIEPIIYNIKVQRPKKLVTKSRLKKKKTLLKLVNEEDIDKCDLEFKDLAKEYDNIFAKEEDTVHSVLPQPTYGKLRAGMEWATVRTNDGHIFTLRKASNLKHTCSCGAKNRLANSTWVAKQVESVMRYVRTTRLAGIQDLISTQFGVNISYYTAWNAWSIYKEKIVGLYDEGYIMQPELCLQILHSNPWSITTVSKDHDTSQWTGTCVMFKASTNGFLNGCKPVIGLFPLGVYFCRRQKAKDWEEKGLVLVPIAQVHIDKLKRQYGQFRLEGTKKGYGNIGHGITGQYVTIAVSGQRWRVNLGTHECDCHELQVTRLPCVNAVSVIVLYRYPWVNFVSKYHKVSLYVKTYKDTIYLVGDPSEWGQPQPPYFSSTPLLRGPRKPRKERIHDPDEKGPQKNVRGRATGRANIGGRTGRNAVGGRTGAREGGDRRKIRGGGRTRRNPVGGRTGGDNVGGMTGTRGGGDRGRARGGARGRVKQTFQALRQSEGATKVYTSQLQGIHKVILKVLNHK
ncbi:hypothetical protein GIB67_012447 [Kingdonia uniflora]|uniref:SWIM-type domain-containing protein n=1 Tax=Kingdonia uniflora TaxID=39325 RepID=A0A7J7N3Q3_9MAGN|nr:hypothetical protein GIB67_012447 [Kingdonia uniflora]